MGDREKLRAGDKTAGRFNPFGVYLFGV